ncbi:extracellular solute-binding protein [Paenibacillus sp. R14(2021)]|uniref:extracellular solute-binding protein n=1 Tax=Paenibacillus sp. R14(2021) TaxID=2859228 RepID=UPI001C61296C|nr:extracellular solute-binding protein [Paenibacillus sp. R14(2021)]
MKYGWKYSSKLVLGTTLVGVLLAGCSGKNNENGKANENENVGGQTSQNEGAASTGEQLSYSLYAPAMTTPINLDGPITQEVMKKSGLHWDKVEIGNGGDLSQQINLKLAAGSFPDAIILPSDSLVWSRLINEKKLLPLDDYFTNPDAYPNLAKIDKRIIDYWRASDGHIYFVPSAYEPVIDNPSAWQGNAQGLWVQNTILKKAGMTTDDLRTIDGFEKYLSAIKDFKDDKGRNIIPLSLGGENFAGLEIVMSMFGVRSTDNGYNEQADGTVVPDYKLPGFKSAFQWLNHLDLNGLLDPETSFQKKDLFKEKVNNLRYGAMLFGGWDNPNVTTLKNHNIPEAITYNELEKKGFPDGWFYPTELPTMKDVKLAQYANYNPFGTNGAGISAKAKDPDQIMKGLDWMQTNEAFVLMEYGPESSGAYKMENGAAVENYDVFRGPKFWGGDNGGMASVTQYGFWWWKNLASVGSSHIKTMESPWPAYNAMLYKAEEINHKQGTFGLTPKAARIKPTIGGAVEKYGPVQNDIRMKYYAKMLLAKNDADFQTAYDQFLNEMKVRGHDEETITEFNKEYQAYSDTPAGKITVDIKQTLPRNVYSDKPAIIGE